MTLYHQTIHKYAAAISNMDPDAFAACFAADCELNDPVGTPPAHGQAAAKAFLGGFVPLLSKASFRVGSIHVCGATAAFSWLVEAEGTKGQFGTANGVDVLEFDAAGKIVKSMAYWNPGPLVAALTA